ncbi:MAG: DUF4176 domain-containing protein [Oscillospiraceae bacterium]|nr:DUF4176 domain-containing protein [Oscillospiraceae bacterium]
MLTLGSIVYLKEGSQKLMIINRGVVIEQEGKEQIFDYSSALYPNGVTENNIYYFNEENIDKVIFEGFKDDDEERFQEIFEEWKKNNKDKFIKGNITQPVE